MDEPIQVKDFINNQCQGSPTRLAKSAGVSRQLVNFWKKKGYVIFGGKIYSPRQAPDDAIYFDGRLYVPQSQLTGELAAMTTEQAD